MQRRTQQQLGRRSKRAVHEKHGEEAADTMHCAADGVIDGSSARSADAVGLGERGPGLAVHQEALAQLWYQLHALSTLQSPDACPCISSPGCLLYGVQLYWCAYIEGGSNMAWHNISTNQPRSSWQAANPILSSYAEACHAYGRYSNGQSYTFSNGTAYPANNPTTAYAIAPTTCQVSHSTVHRTLSRRKFRN